ncbi:MAG: OmpH family outer membrane protein [Capnocytophaga sp.]|jgi:outer membrane chaperone skp (ompH)|uniref:Outer membrane protein n=2 Tax=Capnocytophaga ochracea TaxID=1018 RepID=E4MTN6_CAPOC|nr:MULTISPECIES: OmpH family outer membrane protein [Capnocytophaga]EFS96842.1 outer membrane protein [Capnocytophaga ochracea F0287]EJF44513.1 outer membrane protein, OmpH-like protein [Capnocytophaga ochracea str. Holt 25]EPE01437.1 outer membrane protein [Capnocytophaga sp. oral taxon 336 str. F0502]MDU6659605.1 OmpH family outer membrane protein [Capnocytophaga sp.]UEB42511.1 OmpH family outer membrane protein [Capnocytophaga ochracea]
MKKLILTGVALLALTACTDKVAFVDNSKLLNDYQEKKDIEAKLKGQISAYERKRDSISMAFQTEARAFDAQAKTLPQNVAQKKYNELMQKSQILQQHLQQEEQKIQMESQTQMDSLLSKVKKNIKEYGKQKGYTFILGANDGGSVLYGSEKKDITKEVTEYLNNQYKGKK